MLMEAAERLAPATTENVRGDTLELPSKLLLDAYGAGKLAVAIAPRQAFKKAGGYIALQHGGAEPVIMRIAGIVPPERCSALQNGYVALALARPGPTARNDLLLSRIHIQGSISEAEMRGTRFVSRTTHVTHFAPPLGEGSTVILRRPEQSTVEKITGVLHASDSRGIRPGYMLLSLKPQGMS
jgi:hypothetical protein